MRTSHKTFLSQFLNCTEPLQLRGNIQAFPTPAKQSLSTSTHNKGNIKELNIPTTQTSESYKPVRPFTWSHNNAKFLGFRVKKSFKNLTSTYLSRIFLKWPWSSSPYFQFTSLKSILHTDPKGSYPRCRFDHGAQAMEELVFNTLNPLIFLSDSLTKL